MSKESQRIEESLYKRIKDLENTLATIHEKIADQNPMVALPPNIWRKMSKCSGIPYPQEGTNQ